MTAQAQAQADPLANPWCICGHHSRDHKQEFGPEWTCAVWDCLCHNFETEPPDA